MNCLPSAVGFTKSLVTKPKSSSMVTQWLTSRNSTSPVFSAVQACRNVSSKRLFSKAEVSACRMRSFDISDAEIQIMSSIVRRICNPLYHYVHLIELITAFGLVWNVKIILLIFRQKWVACSSNTWSISWEVELFLHTRRGEWFFLRYYLAIKCALC